MFAEVPLDNRTVNKFAAVAATFEPSKPSPAGLKPAKRSNISLWLIFL
jgi:hypothetical protein